MSEIHIVTKTINALTFRCRIAGVPSGKPVILLHGWPETSLMWVKLMEKLSDEGYYCIAPDQRGFSPGARLPRVKDYDIKFLVQDVIALADAFGIGNFHLIGHDWGAAIGWALVSRHPERVNSWTAMSIPHIRAFSEALRFDKKQKKMSRYMAFFQWPYIPEWSLLRKDRAMLRKAWRKSSKEELEEYLDVLGNKRGLTASLGYYRANYSSLLKGNRSEEYKDVKTPTLLIWGKKDIAIGPVGVDGTAQYMKGPYERIDLDAGHFLMQEAFDECSQPILAHLNKYS